jgi:hypothetical protein
MFLKYSAWYCPVVHVPPVAVELNAAVTVELVFPMSVHGAVPLQPPPLHPSKRDPEAAAAVSVTCVMLGNVSVQSLPQMMPTGTLDTVPAPVPDFATVRLSEV